MADPVKGQLEPLAVLSAEGDELLVDILLKTCSRFLGMECGLERHEDRTSDFGIRIQQVALEKGKMRIGTIHQKAQSLCGPRSVQTGGWHQVVDHQAAGAWWS